MAQYNFDFKNLFIQFLKENNIYETFNELYESYYIIPLDDILNTYNKARANELLRMILWYNTPQGFKFWNNLHRKWRATIFKYILPTFVHLIKKNELYGPAIEIINNNSHVLEYLKFESIRLDTYPSILFKRAGVKCSLKNYTNLCEEWKKLFDYD